MKICYVATDVILPETSGGSTHVLEMARALSEQGVDVLVVSRRKNGETKAIKIGSINIQRLYRMIVFPAPFDREGSGKPSTSEEGSSRFLKTLYHLYLRTFYTLFVAIQLSVLIKKNNIQVVFERSESLGAGAIAAKITHRPLIEEMITDWYAPFSLRIAKRILTYTIDVLPTWVEKSKITEVTSSVNTGLFNPWVNPNKIRKKYALERKSVIAYCGGFWGYHGVDKIIEASRDVLSQHPQCCFLMIGPNYQRAESYAKSLGVNEHFIFTGQVKYEEVPDYLTAADICLAPYFPHNGLGNWLWCASSSGTLKVLEYLALGKTVIASRLPLIENVLEDGKTALLVPPGNSKLLGQAINRLLQDPVLSQQIAKQGFELIQEKYTWKYLASIVQQSCRELLAEITVY